MDNKSHISEALIFGTKDPNFHYHERRAAYVVIIRDGLVALVYSGQKQFLPGGGCLLDESPEKTIEREVREELARSVRLLRRLGEATQYFYSPADDRHYKMLAIFFAGEFTDDACGKTGEHQLGWLPVPEVERACFHQCHAWAIRQW
jgi:ADP-ribose pyrophosphatase YjhB (NUDIX family)